MDIRQELLRHVKEARAKLRSLIQALLDAAPLADENKKIILSWRLLLLGLAHDVSGSIYALGLALDDNHARSMRVLDRSLFEYGLRLEYYFYYPEDGVSHAKAMTTWWNVLLKASAPYMDTEGLTDAERDILSNAIESTEKVEYANVRAMLKKSLQANGFSKDEAEKRELWIYNNYYNQGSTLAHGSQGAFIDFFTKDPASGAFEFMLKSPRFTVADTLFNTTLHLIQFITSEEKHRNKYLGSDMFLRDFELTTGREGYVFEVTRRKH